MSAGRWVDQALDLVDTHRADEHEAPTLLDLLTTTTPEETPAMTTTTETVTVTILCPAGEVHKQGCQDVARRLKNRGDFEAQASYDVAVASAEEAAEEFWADFIDSGEMTAEDAHADIRVMPCVRFPR